MNDSPSKILHQVWIQGEDKLPTPFKQNREAWRHALPLDWEMRLWDEESACRQWPKYRALSKRCFHHATRADLILARAQRDFGGLATGTDVIPVNVPNLLEWLATNGTLVVVNIRARSASNGISYFEAVGNPFIRKVCKAQVEDEEMLSHANVWRATGPGCWFRVLASKMWNLALATDQRAYTKLINGSPVNPVAWVDPGCAGSWHTKSSVEEVDRRA